LLLTTSIRGAARRAGIGRKALRAWMQEPEFQAAYRRARTELVEQTIGRLVGAGALALKKLIALLNDPSPQGQLGAAKAILDHMFRGEIAELGAEVQKLIEAQAEAAARASRGPDHGAGDNPAPQGPQEEPAPDKSTAVAPTCPVGNGSAFPPLPAD